MRYGPTLTVGVNLALAILFATTAAHRSLAVALCAVAVCGLLVGAALCWPRSKPRPKFQLFTSLALLGATLLWGGVLALIADPQEKLPTALYYLIETGMYGGIALLVVTIFLQWAAVRDERERNALP